MIAITIVNEICLNFLYTEFIDFAKIYMNFIRRFEKTIEYIFVYFTESITSLRKYYTRNTLLYYK